MRHRQSEKMEIIRLVEQSPLNVKQTLAELNINRSTFYKWYRRYQEGGYQALANRYRPPKQFWNSTLRSHRVSWPGTSLTNKAIISQSHRYTGS
jgi:transposase-like protein